MIVACSSARCDVVVSAYVFHATRRPKNWKSKQGRPVVARKVDYRPRYRVECSFAWPGNFWRPLVRWEHQSSAYQGFFTVALLLICLRRVCPLPLRVSADQAAT